MVTVLGMWEATWLDPERSERRLWKQTIQAYGVDRWAMCSVHGGPFTSPVQFKTLEEMLAAHSGPKTFLIAPGRSLRSRTRSLREYSHPRDAIYVFGNVTENLLAHVRDVDDVVEIRTPNKSVLFAPVALGAVLHDRSMK